MIEILTDNHYDAILDLFDSAENSIKIISPFISESMAKKLCDIVESNHNVKCTFITRFYLEDMASKANSIDAIEMMIDVGIEVYALKGLHTKLYLFDDSSGIIGSANFTTAGFTSNIELSLHIEDESYLLKELHEYFDNMVIKIIKCQENIITKDVLELAREKYNHLLSTKKEKGNNFSTYMFGAVIDKRAKFETTEDIIRELGLCKNENDIVNDIFKQTEETEQIKYDHTIWLKFHGEGNNRMNSESLFRMTNVMLNGRKIYLTNYPFKVASVKEDDEVYLAALTTDSKGKNQPVIVGRGYLKAFESTNVVRDDWIEQHDWMERYPWYVIIKECRVLNTPIKDGVAMDVIWDELGSDTYISSFGKNETFAQVSKKHHQKAHIRLSGNAKQFIDKKLDDLEVKYGTTSFTSEV